jgi:predicted adenylyl cyclase CyaB
MRKNIEIKARCNDLSAARRAAKKLGMRRVGILHQTDTYFHAPHGRLKLREIRGQRAELIWYDRPNRASARDSHYTIVHIDDPRTMKTALTLALGVSSVVIKRRELWMFRNVRIHLDEIGGLGTFIELEAVIAKGNAPALSRRRLGMLCEVLGIRKQDQLAASYGELIADL